jgi:hypothetical protein
MEKEKSTGGSLSWKQQLIYIAVFIVLIGLTFYAIIGQNEGLTLSGFINYTLSLQIPWLVAAAGCVFLFIMLEGLSIRYIASKLGYKRGLYHSFLYSAADIYFSAVTPSATGGQPASAYFMVKDKIPMSVTTITLVLNIMQYTLSLVVIAGCCFVLRPEYFFLFDGWSKLLIVLGIVFQLAFALLFAFVVFFPDIIRKLGEGCINILFRIHIIRKRRKKLNSLYKMIEEYRLCAAVLKKTPVIMVVAFLFNLLQRVAIISVTYCVYQGSGGGAYSFIDVMVMQGYVLVGSNSIPVPGAVGVADYLFLDGFKNIFADPINGEIISRGLSFYICIIVCGGFSLAHQARLMFKSRREK